jgi:hypothetical protein
MPIIIDRTSNDVSCQNYITVWDDSLQYFLFNYLTDVTFTDTTKNLKLGLNNALAQDWVYLPKTDHFATLAFTKDLDIIIHAPLLKVYESGYWFALYYDIEIDYNPLRGSDYAFHFMNIVLNMWDGLNIKADNSVVFIGMKYAYWDHTGFTYPDLVNCALWAKPSARRVVTSRANYARWSIDVPFLLSVKDNITVCGVSP